MRELPENWKLSKLSEVAEILQGQSPPSSTYNDEGIGLPFFQGKTEFGDLYPTTRKYCSEPNKIAEPDDVLISVRAPVGPTNLALEKSCIGRGLAAIRPLGDTPARYFLYYLRSIEQELASKGTGTTFQAISGKILRETKIPIAPLSEQRRIVARIEELFSRLDAGVAALRKAKVQLKRYRQSVLAAAISGQLTQAWREQRPDTEPAEVLLERILKTRKGQWDGKGKYKEPTLPDTGSTPNIPNEWVWTSWEAILSGQEGGFKRGPFGSALKKSMFVEIGYKVYEQYCPINDDCSFARYYITPLKFKELKAFAVRAGDYLISCSGVTLGRITRVPNHFEEGVINQALLRVRINEDAIDHRYFLLLFRSPFFQTKLFANTAGVAIPNVKGVNDLKRMPIPLPPLAEQYQLVAEVEARTTAINHLEAELDRQLTRSGRLRQSVLAHAFNGRFRK